MNPNLKIYITDLILDNYEHIPVTYTSNIRYKALHDLALIKKIIIRCGAWGSVVVKVLCY